MSKGFIQLDREVFESGIFKNKEPFSKREAWIDILIMVNYKDSKIVVGNTLIECKAGQSILSQESWAKRWNWDRSQVRRYFELLQKSNMIEIESVQKTTRITVLIRPDNAQDLNENCTDFAQKSTMITTLKSDSYEQARPDSDPILTHGRPDSDPITDHNIISNKEIKEEGNNNKEIGKSEFSKNENYALLSENEFIKSELEKANELIKTLEEEKKKNPKESSAKEKGKIFDDLVFDFPEDFSEETKDLFMKFIANRKKIKKEVKTQRALNGLIEKLKPFNDNIRVIAIDNSINANWMDLFPKPEERSSFTYNNHDKKGGFVTPNALNQPDKYQIANENVKARIMASIAP